MSCRQLRHEVIKNTRKLHYCNWCGEIIEIGSTCISFFNITDGDVDAGYFHCECDNALDKSMAEDDDIAYGGYIYESMSYIRGKTEKETEEIREEKSKKEENV